MRRTEFSAKTKLAAYERAGGRCEKCGARLTPGKIRYDHIVPCELGGDASLENCSCQCVTCDKPKTAIDQSNIAKAKRCELKHKGAWRSKSIVPGSKASRFKKHLDGRVTLRSHSDRKAEQ